MRNLMDWIKSIVTVEQIVVAKFIVTIILSLYFFIVFFVMVKRTEHTVKKNNGKYVERMLSSTGVYMEKMGKYNETKLFLSQYGANYMMGRPVAPEEYTLLNLFFALIFSLLGMLNFGLLGMILGAFIGFHILKWLLLISNKSDNEKILFDMKVIYDTLKIKTEGGMFLTAALQECYKNARNRRLKEALLEMHNEIITKSNVTDAVEKFNLKFKNKYIDTFCIIIKQSLESGKTVEILKDMSEQLAEMQQTINLKAKNKLDAQIQAIQLLIYVAILVLCIYGLMMSMSEFTL